MRALVQRVSYGKVSVEGQTISEISHGLMVFLGVGHGDAESQAAWLSEKIANLRIFEDAEGKMNLSVRDVGGSALVVSQFTLYADSQKGRRPSFVEAALPNVAEPLVDKFAEMIRQQGVPAGVGVFGAHMLVEIHNDGPVTIWLER